MTNEEILQKALEKAINNGYNLEEVWEPVNCRDKTPQEAVKDIVEIYVTQPGGIIPESDVMRADFLPIYKTIIFNHEFAKAFWGELIQIEWPVKEELNDSRFGYKIKPMPIWKFHLQQMILEKNPLKYLEKFIKN